MSASPAPAITRAWGVLITVFAVEAVGGIILLAWFLSQLNFSPENPFRGITISMIIAMILLVLWVVIALVGALRTRASWVRGSAVTIHVLLFAAGTGVLQGIIGTEPFGWALVILAIIGFFTALRAKPVRPTLDAE